MKRLLLAALVLASPAAAHDQWSNDMPIPAWIKASCCGKADVHHLRPDQVHQTENYYEVDGYRGRIERKVALPSEDGDYWIFYSENGGVQSSVWCFFVPMAY